MVTLMHHAFNRNVMEFLIYIGKFIIFFNFFSVLPKLVMEDQLPKFILRKAFPLDVLSGLFSLYQ